ncbi:MAG: hypothetical protein P8O91_02125 [Luminiphilus sp.]|nr:hypothetical protein [Luminiphilus sp.]
MRDIAFRQQILTTLLLLGITFGLWMAAEPLLATPAKWLAHFLLTFWLPNVIETTIFEPGALLVVTNFTEVDGIIRMAMSDEEGLAFRLNTRLVSYGLPFYAALLWGSRIDKPFNTFAWGLFVLWAAMALGLAAMTAKDLMLVIGQPFLATPWVPPPPVIAVSYQFSVLLMPTLAPVLLWVFQLRDSPLWKHLESQLEGSARE